MAIKIVLIFIIILIVSRIADKFWRKEIRLSELLLWSVFWLGVAWFVVWPETSSFLAEYLGVGRGVDLMVYLAIILIFYLLFRIFVRFEKMDRDMTKIVQKIALDEAKRNDEG